jgi:hypothetical protein
MQAVLRSLPTIIHFSARSLALGQAPAADCGADGSVVNAVTGQPFPGAGVFLEFPTMVGTIARADGKWALTGLACTAVQFKAYRAGFITGLTEHTGPRQECDLMPKAQNSIPPIRR